MENIQKPLWAVILLAVIALVGELTGVWEAIIDWARSEELTKYYQLQRVDGEKVALINGDASFAAVINQTDTTKAINYKWSLEKPNGESELLQDNNSFVSIDLPCTDFKPGAYTVKVQTSLIDGTEPQEKSMKFRVDPYLKDSSSFTGWSINDACAHVNLPQKIILGDNSLNIIAAKVTAIKRELQ